MKSTGTRLAKVLLTVLSLCTLSLCLAAGDSGTEQTSATDSRVYLGLDSAGTITTRTLSEISGMVTSAIQKNRLWVVNDSGHTAELHLVSRSGKHLHTVEVDSFNRDWEALSIVKIRGRPFLLIGDTGDNLKNQSSYRILIVDEQEALTSTTVQPQHILYFRYPDGPANTEAMAVMPRENRLLLFPRKAGGEHSSQQVYSIPLDLNTTDTLTARLEGRLKLPFNPTDHLLSKLANYDLTQPTDASISANGTQLWISTYRSVLLWGKPDSTVRWHTVLAQPPAAIIYHDLRQAEAISSAGKNTALVTSEQLPAPLLQITTR